MASDLGGAAETSVELPDTKGRKLAFALNGAGAVDLYVDGKLKVQRVRDLRIVGSAIHLEGKRLMFTDRALVVPDTHQTSLSAVSALCEKTKEFSLASDDVRRCFVFVKNALLGFPAGIAGKVEVFCQVSVSGIPTTACSTCPVTACAEPIWDESFELPCWNQGDDVDVRIYSRSAEGCEECMGAAKITQEHFAQSCFEGALELSSGSGAANLPDVQGRVFVRVELCGSASETPAAGDAENSGQEAQPRAKTALVIDTGDGDDDADAHSSVASGQERSRGHSSAGSARCSVLSVSLPKEAAGAPDRWTRLENVDVPGHEFDDVEALPCETAEELQAVKDFVEAKGLAGFSVAHGLALVKQHEKGEELLEKSLRPTDGFKNVFWIYSPGKAAAEIEAVTANGSSDAVSQELKASEEQKVEADADLA